MSRKYAKGNNPAAVQTSGALTGPTPVLVVPASNTMTSCSIANLDGTTTFYVGPSAAVTGPSGIGPYGAPVAPGGSFGDSASGGPWYAVCDGAGTPKYSATVVG